MKVTVKLFAQFRNDRFIAKELELPETTTCLDVVLSLAITEDEIGVVLINGRHGSLSHPLQEGETLALFPLVGGG